MLRATRHSCMKKSSTDKYAPIGMSVGIRPVSSLDNLQIYAGVRNLFDRDPPAVPLDFISNVATNTVWYDVIGRRYYIGVLLAF